MKIRHAGHGTEQNIELQMTPMIDIVFQLLVFFIMTFKIVEQEGDFNIKMPLAVPNEGTIDETLIPPMKLRLIADSTGAVASIALNEQTFGRDFNQLNRHIINIVGGDSGPSSFRESLEVELHCDYHLRYEETVRAVTAVTGWKDSETGNIIKLIEKVKFAPPQEPGG